MAIEESFSPFVDQSYKARRPAQREPKSQGKARQQQQHRSVEDHDRAHGGRGAGAEGAAQQFSYDSLPSSAPVYHKRSEGGGPLGSPVGGHAANRSFLKPIDAGGSEEWASASVGSMRGAARSPSAALRGPSPSPVSHYVGPTGEHWFFGEAPAGEGRGAAGPAPGHGSARRGGGHRGGGAGGGGARSEPSSRLGYHSEGLLGPPLHGPSPSPGPARPATSLPSVPSAMPRTADTLASMSGRLKGVAAGIKGYPPLPASPAVDVSYHADRPGHGLRAGRAGEFLDFQVPPSLLQEDEMSSIGVDKPLEGMGVGGGAYDAPHAKMVPLGVALLAGQERGRRGSEASGGPVYAQHMADQLQDNEPQQMLGGVPKMWYVDTYASSLPAGRRDVLRLDTWLNERNKDTEEKSKLIDVIAQEEVGRLNKQKSSFRGKEEALLRCTLRRNSRDLEVMQEEYDNYTVCMNELVRQVSIGCVERGRLMGRLWEGCMKLWRQVLDINTELSGGVSTMLEEHPKVELSPSFTVDSENPLDIQLMHVRAKCSRCSADVNVTGEGMDDLACRFDVLRDIIADASGAGGATEDAKEGAKEGSPKASKAADKRRSSMMGGMDLAKEAAAARRERIENNPNPGVALWVDAVKKLNFVRNLGSMDPMEAELQELESRLNDAEERLDSKASELKAVKETIQATDAKMDEFGDRLTRMEFPHISLGAFTQLLEQGEQLHEGLWSALGGAEKLLMAADGFGQAEQAPPSAEPMQPPDTMPVALHNVGKTSTLELGRHFSLSWDVLDPGEVKLVCLDAVTLQVRHEGRYFLRGQLQSQGTLQDALVEHAQDEARVVLLQMNQVDPADVSDGIKKILKSGGALCKLTRDPPARAKSKAKQSHTEVEGDEAAKAAQGKDKGKGGAAMGGMMKAVQMATTMSKKKKKDRATATPPPPDPAADAKLGDDQRADAIKGTLMSRLHELKGSAEGSPAAAAVAEGEGEGEGEVPAPEKKEHAQAMLSIWQRAATVIQTRVRASIVRKQALGQDQPKINPELDVMGASGGLKGSTVCYSVCALLGSVQLPQNAVALESLADSLDGFLCVDQELSVYQPVRPLEAACVEMEITDLLNTSTFTKGRESAGGMSFDDLRKMEKVRVVAQLQRHYVELKDVFHFYCIHNSGNSHGYTVPFEMSWKQFQAFAKECRFTATAYDLEQVFRKALNLDPREEADDQDDLDALNMAMDDFLETVVRLGHLCYYGRLVKEKGAATLTEVAELAVRNALKHAFRLNREGDTFRAEYAEGESLIMRKYGKQLAKLFKSIASKSESQSALQGLSSSLTINCSEWIYYLRKAKVFSTHKLSVSTALEAFALSSVLKRTVAEVAPRHGTQKQREQRAVQDRDEQQIADSQFIMALVRVSWEIGVPKKRNPTVLECAEKFLDETIFGSPPG